MQIVQLCAKYFKLGGKDYTLYLYLFIAHILVTIFQIKTL